MVTHSSRDYPSGFEDLLNDATHSRLVWPQSRIQRARERNGVEPPQRKLSFEEQEVRMLMP